MSYSEIQKSVPVPKSTISLWLKRIKLTGEQKKKLKERQVEAIRAGSQKKISQLAKRIEEVQKISAKNIRKISRRELWLMGIVLYWRERSVYDLRKGVRFTSSDPYLIKFFLQWLKDVGRIEDGELQFDIFIPQNKPLIGKDKRDFIDELVAYWMKATKFPKEYFPRIYFQKVRRRRSKRKVFGRSKWGMLRVRVRASSMLARQISGWIKGIKSYYWEES